MLVTKCDFAEISDDDILLDVSCDKDKLVDDALVLHVFDPVTCAKNTRYSYCY